MAGRRSLRSQQPEEEPQGRRRSLRLARQKAAPFNYQRSLAYQAPTNSAQIDFATPRTVFKKVLQTQPIVSPLVSEKPESPKPIDTIFNFPVKLGSSINLEVSLSDSTQRQKSRLARHPTRSKKVRVSEFERDLNNQLHFSTAQGLLDHTSLTNSLQISFTTPAPLNSAGRKGLIRRPKNYRGVNVKDFEGGLEQDLLQIKDSAENNPEDQKTTTLQSNNTEALSVETELFLPPHSSEENETEPSNVLPGPDLARKPFGRRSAPSLSQTRLARQDEISDMEVEKVAESSPPKTLTSGREIIIEPETESTEKDESYQEKCQEKPQDAGKGLRPSLGKEKLSPGPEDASSIESISQKRIDTPQKQQRKHFQGNSPDEELFTPTEPLKTGLGARRSSTQVDAQLPGASQRNFSTWLSRKIVRRSVNEMAAHITKELDSIVPSFAGPSMAEVDSEEGSSLREITFDITQSPREATPGRRASGKTPKTLEGTPFKATRDRTNPQTGDKNRRKLMRNVETEQILEFEAKDNPEVEEMSESEDVATEISQSPRVATPGRRASGKTPKTLERFPFKEMRERTNPQTGDKNRRKQMRNVETEEILEFEAKDNPEVEEMSESEDVAIEISQSPRVATPGRRASGKTPKTLERFLFKEMRDRTNPQTGDKNRRKQMRNVETEKILEFEAKDNPEVEEMSDSEDVATEISQSPRVATPGRRASGKTPKTLEGTPFKAMRERTNPQTGDKNRRKLMRNVETEEILEFEAKGNPEVEEMSESEDVATEISQSPRVATPGRRASGKTPKTLERFLFKEMRERTNPQTGDKNRRKQMNVETEKILEFEAKDNPEVEEMSESEDVAIEISQSPRVATPGRRASGKTPKTLERFLFKEMRDRTNPQTGDKNRRKQMRNVETEKILEFEAKDNPEVEEMSDSEDVATEISQSPRVATPGRRASGKTPKTLERFPFKEMRERTNPQTGDKNRRKQMRNVETEKILEFEAKDNPEVEEMSDSEDVATEISQSPRVATPGRRASGKTPKTLERFPFKEMRERTNPQTGDKNRRKQMRNVETEEILEFEAKDNPEVEEMSESEDVATEISQSPRVATPGRRASGKTPKTLEGTPFKAMRDRTNPQTGDKNRRKQMRNVETEQILEFGAKNNPEVEMSESEDVAIEISQSPRVATPGRRASGKTPKTLEGTPFKATRDRTNPQTGDKNRRKQMRNVETEQILEFEAKNNPEVEMSESEDVAIEISQSPRVATPSRRASGKTPKTLERTFFKATRERTNPQTGDRNRTKEMTNVETEEILEFEAEDNPEVEEMSEAEDVEPTGSTPAFVRAKAFHCTPLLSSPRVLKEVASGSPVKQNLVQRVPKPAKKARREKREPSLPSNLVKKMFTHYIKMPVTKEALQVVDRCVNVYFKHLSNDLEAYANHARRKTAEAADLELLMRRQGLITDKTPLNVLVERHLPLEYRKLLIPIAISGNKVIPQKLK
ncbi:centromere protein T [Pantherophis guttatus]|uniref:Centromere protein T n=1 Tax=Pantherophis guttatus TaxID=94885 RepID=A0ABM3YN70_PANGU|nr:centromere protein T [Pantherophis guttatus]